MHLRALFLALIPLSVVSLRAADVTPPTVQSATPATSATVSNLTQITVTFSEPVVGVQAPDLIVNDVPALFRSGGGATWTFLFSQPPPGPVAVDFDVDTAITDTNGNPFNALDSGASWLYTLADTAPPVIARTTPVQGASITALTQIEVVFNEPVSGVNAPDLLVNGAAASTVTLSGADKYLFQFTQPLSGAVTISWADGHGIQDLAASPNAFGGAGWGCTLNPALVADVVINEFLADNLNSVADADEQKADWIELHNRGASSVNLLGWSLTDDAADPGRWTLPAVTLNAGQYLFVFASGKDRKTTTAGATNHASFTLPAGGGYLALCRPELPRAVVSEFAAYPEQRADVSYGLMAGNTASYFSVPTPGAANNAGSAVSGFTLPPHTSVNSGFFNLPFNLALASDTPGAAIRYTLDGSAPGPSNTLYTAALPIAGTPQRGAVTVRAAAFKAGLLPSTPITRTYIFPDFVLMQSTNPPGFPTNWISPCTIAGINCQDADADYEMDPQVLTNTVNNYGPRARAGLLTLPTISIVTHTNLLFGPALGVYVRREPSNQQPVNVEMIYPDGSSGFNMMAGLEVVGGTSPNDQGTTWKSRKLNMRLIFRGEFGPTKLRHRVFPDSAAEEFDTLIVDAGSNYYWTYNGSSSTEDQRRRSTYTRDQYMADLQNAMGRTGPHGRYVHVYLNGLYWGMHCLHERPDHSFSASYFGGDKNDYSVIKHRVATVVNGSNTDYVNMHALSRTGLGNNAVYESIQAQLDLPWYIDYMIMNHYAGNEDWAHQNWYCSRAPGKGWRYLSWDAEHTFKALSWNSVTDLDPGDTPTALFQLLRANTEFRLRFADHVHRHFFNRGVFHTPTTAPLTNAALLAANRPATLFMRRINEVDAAMVAESARWGDTGETTTSRANNPLTRDGDWFTEVEGLMGRTNVGGYSTSYFPLRASTVLGQMMAQGVYPSNQPPVFSRHGGAVPVAYALYMTNVSAGSSVYYTTNGGDPRVYGSGAVSGQASTYAGSPVILGRSTIVKARSLLGTNWSALNEAVFTIGTLGVPLRITEIMYNPEGGSAYEFIELLNAGLTDLNLGGYSFEGVSFAFPPAFTLPAGARIVLASDGNPAGFAARYPGVIVAGYFGGSLDNTGERLAIIDTAGSTVLSVDYRDDNGWPGAADGGGYSLEMIDTDGSPDDPANWRTSLLNGTPGIVPSSPPAPAVVLNEIMAENLATTNNGGTYPDWVELYNPSGSPVDLTGWSLSDNGNPRRFVFTNGPVIGAGGHFLVWCDTNFAAPGLHTSFALDRDGGSVFLHDPNTNRADAISFGAQLADLSIGRIAGAWSLNTPTPGTANSAAITAPASSVVINEWLANTAPGGDDWVELHNASATQPAALSGMFLGTSNANFRLAALSFIAPGGFLQLLADEQPGPKHLDFKLPSAGGAIALYDADAIEINRVTYGAQAQGVTSGRYPNGSASIVTFPASASPAASNYVVTYTGPVLNEIMARNTSALAGPWGDYPDWVEFYNPNAFATNIGGMSLAQSADGAGAWSIPAGTTVGANDFLVVYCNGSQPPSTNSAASLNAGFNLSADGDGLYLFNAAGQIMNQIGFGFQIADRTLGLNGGIWKLLDSPTPGAANSAATTLAAATSVRFNEWMPNPARGNDWFELFNTNALPADLAGLYLTDDPSITGVTNFQIAPLSFIAGGGWAKFIADGDPSQGREHVNFNLDALGDALRLYNTNLALIDSADFGALSAGVSQGRLPDGGSNTVSFPLSPTPAGANYLPLPGVVINEVLTRAEPPGEDAVELANLTGLGASIGGWFLSDSDANLRKYRIAPGTNIAANGFIVFTQSQFGSNTDAGALVPFTFNGAHGGAAYLSAADGSGNLTGYRSQFAFGAAATGEPFGRHVTSVGTDLPAAGAVSLGTNNPYPRVGAVAINEVMYHPVTNAGPMAAENEAEEFIELYNLTTNAVALYDAAHPSNTWRLAGGVEFDFPANVSLPSRSFLLVVNFNPATDPGALASFRARYGVPVSVPVHGPYGGRLDNGGEPIELFRPDVPLTSPPDAGFIPRVLVDRVEYSATVPWPAEAAGATDSLQRRRPYNYGNDPVNWKSEAPTAGRANVPGSTFTDTDGDGLPDDWEAAHGLGSMDPSDAAADPDGDGHSSYEEFLDGTDPQLASSRLDAPVVTAQPQNVSTTAGATASFSVTASGTEPLRYQWRFNGAAIANAANATLTMSNVQPADAGTYSAAVLNGAGFAFSQGASMSVIVPPMITVHPTNQVVNPNASATFNVSASGNGVIRYQWTFNGTPIPGATSAAFTTNNVTLGSEGVYAALVTDDIATLTSQSARLIVKVPPMILIPPVSQTNAVGASATYTVRASGSVPMTFFWRRGSTPILTNILYATNDSLTLTNMSLGDSNLYRVIITNYAVILQLTNAAFTNAVWPATTITSQPTNRTVIEGGPAGFTVTASSHQLRYQWLFNGAPIASATNATLSLSNIQPAQAGGYSALVTNIVGAATSQTATLTVLIRPILTEPEYLANGMMRFKLLGNSNQAYFIEASTNLVDWPTLTNLLTTNALMPFLDGTSPGVTNRFYRARLAP